VKNFVSDVEKFSKSRLFGLRKFFNIRNEIFHRRAKWDGAVCKTADFLDLENFSTSETKFFTDAQNGTARFAKAPTFWT